VPSARSFRRRLADAAAAPQRDAGLLLEALGLVAEDIFSVRVAA
jgi:hypothetical protein